VPKSGAASVVLDGDLRYISGNEAAFALLGMTPDQVIGRRHLDLFPEAEGSPAHVAMLDALRTMQPQRTRIFSIPLQRTLDLEVHVISGQLHVVVKPVDEPT
jgi:PAS domain S-box-containing protein